MLARPLLHKQLRQFLRPSLPGRSALLSLRPWYPSPVIHAPGAQARAASIPASLSNLDSNEPLASFADMNVIEVDEGPEGEGGTYMCQEEPHMVGHPPGPGFIPLRFGDKLYDGRYVIVRKLGYSLTSSVWLAKDLRYASLCKDAALTILTIVSIARPTARVM